MAMELGFLNSPAPLPRRWESVSLALYTATLPLPVTEVQGSGPPWTLTHTMTIDPVVAGGSGLVWLEVVSPEGNIVAGSNLPLVVPPSPLFFSLLDPAPQAPDGTISAMVAITNTSSDLAVAGASVGVMLTTPDSTVTATNSTSFDLLPMSSQVAAVPLSAPAQSFGEYPVEARTADIYGERFQEQVWSTLPVVQGTLGEPFYRLDEVAQLDLHLVNPGPFTLPIDILLSSDMPSSNELATILAPYESWNTIIEVRPASCVCSGSNFLG